MKRGFGPWGQLSHSTSQDQHQGEVKRGRDPELPSGMPGLRSIWSSELPMAQAAARRLHSPRLCGRFESYLATNFRHRKRRRI